MSGLDKFLNILMPTLVILVILGFLWLKTPLGEWLGPHLLNFWYWLKGESQNITTKKEKVIGYE